MEGKRERENILLISAGGSLQVGGSEQAIKGGENPKAFLGSDKYTGGSFIDSMPCYKNPLLPMLAMSSSVFPDF